jgi:hypothetical protein
MAAFLKRYVAGDCIPVWRELAALGGDVRQKRYYADAAAVAAETMRRARQNVEALIGRLDAMGYRFLTLEQRDAIRQNGVLNLPTGRPIPKRRKPPLKDPLVLAPPAKSTAKDLDRLEELAGGPLPLSLRAWYEQVGAVSLLGLHAALDPCPDEAHWDVCPDPLMIDPLTGCGKTL